MRARPDAYSEKTRRLQTKLAVAHRWNLPDRDQRAREYAESRLADYIGIVLDAAPPFTDEQVERLSTLLRGGEAQ